MSYFDSLFFGLYPYVAGAVFLIGSWLRYDQAQYTWRAGSSQMLSNSGMRLASNLFHVGILVIFFGHLVGLQGLLAGMARFCCSCVVRMIHGYALRVRRWTWR